VKVQAITSAANPLVKTMKRLAQNASSYKDAGQVWLEGEHLCDAYLQASASSTTLQKVVVSESAQSNWLARVAAFMLQGTASVACEAIVLPDALFAQISGLPSSGGLGFVLALPEQIAQMQPTAHTVILDRVQDAGNVGSILRSAAAFGVTQVLALEGTAALWSPKVLRAAMGAHFALHIVEGLQADDITLDIPMLATHVHAGAMLHELQAAKQIPNPCAWVMGHEGQGVCQALLDKASQRVRIWQAGQESLNVAAAAAVCLYASAAV
jgi:RNA methyltransferase, TrmH family